MASIFNRLLKLNNNSGFFWPLVAVGAAAFLVRWWIEPYAGLIIYRVGEGITTGDSGQLILAGGLLVGLNSARGLPVYLGGLLAGEALAARYPRWGRWKWLLTLAIILGYYGLMAYLERTSTEWGTTIVILALAGFLILWQGQGRLRTLAKVVILVEVMLGSFWLDLTPMLAWAGFGRGELSTGIQLAAEFLQAGDVFDFVGMGFFILLILIAVITTRLIVGYTQRIRDMEEAKRREDELQRIKLAAVEARVVQEMHALVHDLKTPLTTVRGLNSILEMTAVEPRQQEYCRHIDQAVDQMNAMISEILFEDAWQPTGVEDLVNYARAQLIPEKTAQELVFNISPDLPRIRVNRVRLARVLVNVLQNALKATEGSAGGRVILEAYRGDGEVVLAVEDNGEGIPAAGMDLIWEAGYSTRNTSGLGLPFVRRVVEAHGGRVHVTSQERVGTRVEISLPEG